MYVLITGGHTGLGLGVTKNALTAGHTVGLIIRSEARKQETIAQFSELAPELVDGIQFFYADLSDQSHVRVVAAEITAAWPQLDRLFNNAGILTASGRSSGQGNELHYEINTLAPVILTEALKPLLLKSGDAKVINTGTGGMQRNKLNVAPLVGTTTQAGMLTYMQSKQAAMLLLNDITESWPGVTFVTVDPGSRRTDMTRNGDAPAIITKFLSRFFGDPAVGSQRIYDAGFAEQFTGASAVYITGNKIAAVRHGMNVEQKQALLAGISG
ncbi:SDR family NAD(P)-dependent oxidoreductase [Salinibacterium sp. SWN167]|uniref:SDR family NAD(P)-dependent oxidoreductase n=1 Tax=Salinibacterium sp. SWN167 TaxID=2792054 RepID=UPI0018CF8989|nr:SDR family NAD(P)-dependent oxidoreductase [Salinibacterium sp. SWN167]MBH0082756.1 SDR family NAD(P)-dependent oxidoreductase [Salinibacterium sp. SWN167]